MHIAVCLPLFSLTLCILLSIHLHWESSTATHCRVPNYLPSISAAVGNYEPEKYVWRIGIALHSFLRIVIATVYLEFYQEAIALCHAYFRRLVELNFALSVIENLCLLFITYVSSVENYEFHKYSFGGFIFSSLIYQATTCFLFRQLGNVSYSAKNYYSLKRKLLLFVGNLFSFFVCIYFFWRHNKYCEPGVYSLFALFEYLVVLTNISFHGTAAVDFRDTVVDIPVKGLVGGVGKIDSWSA